MRELALIAAGFVFAVGVTVLTLLAVTFAAWLRAHRDQWPPHSACRRTRLAAPVPSSLRAPTRCVRRRAQTIVDELMRALP